MQKLRQFVQRFVQRWWRVALVIMVLISGGWLVRRFLPQALQFIGVNTDLIQGVQSAVELIGVLLGVGYVAYNFVRAQRAAETPTVIVATQATIDELLQKRLADHDLDAEAKEYLRVLVDRFRYLDTRGMGITDHFTFRLPLLDLYVPLKARIALPEGETWTRTLKVAGRQMSEAEIAGVGDRLSDPQPLAELFQKNAGLIILGDPGAGKSTFMKVVALNAALNLDGQRTNATRLPFLLPLSAFAKTLADHDLPLDQCMADYWRGLSSALKVAPLLKDALRQGKALLLLDGLDEVRDPQLRKRVVDATTHFFSEHKAKGNKFVLTSRIVGYKEVRPPGVDGLQECTIVDFEQEEIERFADQWTKAIATAAHNTSELIQWDAERERKALLDAVARNDGVRLLAANPLLLTILALMKRQGIDLPERRADLYETYVLTLLKHWNAARGWGRPPTSDLDEKETLKLLAPLALWMHEVSPGVGLVEEAEVERKLVELCQLRGLPNPEATCTQFLRDVHDHSALLLERGQRQYGFIHLTFQEYLAAMALAQQGQRDHRAVVQALAAHIDDPNWHEVSLLAIGYIGLVQRNDEVASAVLTDLLAQAPGAAGQAAVLAGECVADVGLTGVTPACRQAVITHLTQTLGDAVAVNVQRRAAAGRILAQRNLGDPRRAVTDLTALEFCYVPAGPFWLGSAADAEGAYADEKPEQEFDLPYAYWISRYPISNGQFAAFVAAQGYANPAYWPEAQAQELWRPGEVREVLYRLNEKQDGLVRNVGGWRKQPVNFGEPYNLPNHPVVGVNWYEALAFSRWLHEYLAEKGWLPSAGQVQLPNEPEWEKAARGGMAIPQAPLVQPLSQLQIPAKLVMIENQPARRRYPWGDKADPNRLNYKASEIQSTSALGVFPTGASPYGAEELSGNVWEWTRSLWGSNINQPAFGYPYQAGDGREQLDAGVEMLRVMRGGSWYNEERRTRCAVRSRYDPGVRNDNLGMRVVVCAPIPLASGALASGL